LKEEIILDILNEPDKHVVNDSNYDGDDSDNCEDDIAVAAVDEEDSQMDEEVTVTMSLFGRTFKIIMGNMNTGGET
jgi:hypothetical protein